MLWKHSESTKARYLKLALKTYDELVSYSTFDDRFEYLKLDGRVSELTFGELRYLNQIFYTSDVWRKFRREIIARDLGCEFGLIGYDIIGIIVVHHINPITSEDLLRHSYKLIDPQNAICVSDATHKALHYSSRANLPVFPTERTPNDTCPWKTVGGTSWRDPTTVSWSM